MNLNQIVLTIILLSSSLIVSADNLTGVIIIAQGIQQNGSACPDGSVPNPWGAGCINCKDDYDPNSNPYFDEGRQMWGCQ